MSEAASGDGMTAKQRRLAKRAAALPPRRPRARQRHRRPRRRSTPGRGGQPPESSRLASERSARGRRAGAGARRRDVGARRPHDGQGAASAPPRQTAPVTAGARTTDDDGQGAPIGKSAAARRGAHYKRSAAVAPSASSTTTKERIESFFRSQGVEGSLKVRLLTDAKTKRSRGMAFVECETAEALYACVACHHAHLDGRRVNVEKSAGGGKATKKDKLKRHRERQDAKIEESVGGSSASSCRRVGSRSVSLMKVCGSYCSGALEELRTWRSRSSRHWRGGNPSTTPRPT